MSAQQQNTEKLNAALLLELMDTREENDELRNEMKALKKEDRRYDKLNANETRERLEQSSQRIRRRVPESRPHETRSRR